MDMKKSYVATVTAVAVAFVAAVGVCIRALFAPKTVFSASQTELRVVLDAGHGGIDGGVTGVTTGIKESELNLTITLKMKEVFEDAGFVVTLTRKTGAGLYGAPVKGFKKRDMQKRKEIIEETNPALVLSVHQNFYPSKTPRGAQVFYGHDKAGKTLADNLQKTLIDTLNPGSNRSIKKAKGVYLMEHLTCTAVLIECGFLSNPQEDSLLQTKEYQQRINCVIAGTLSQFLTDS